LSIIASRIPISSSPEGAFVYVLHFEDSNFLVIGIGHESRNGLQLCHLPGVHIPSAYVHQTADEIDDHGMLLKTGKLAPYLGGRKTLDLCEMPLIQKEVSDAMRWIHDEVWGHPMDWEPHFVDFDDGRFIWLAYEADIDKVKIGIGFVNDSNERMLGDPSYAIGKGTVEEFTSSRIVKPTTLYFYAQPPRWPQHFIRYTEADETKRVMMELRAMANKLWRMDF
jgi:hypothetical protein